ncbi:MAG TPA: hypothetical protein VIY48_09890, partial [Candidatus Paceibacterota bacterium]
MNVRVTDQQKILRLRQLSRELGEAYTIDRAQHQHDCQKRPSTAVDMKEPITKSIGETISIHWSVPEKDVDAVVGRHMTAQYIYHRYLKAEAGIPYAL